MKGGYYVMMGKLVFQWLHLLDGKLHSTSICAQMHFEIDVHLLSTNFNPTVAVTCDHRGSTYVRRCYFEIKVSLLYTSYNYKRCCYVNESYSLLCTFRFSGFRNRHICPVVI